MEKNTRMYENFLTEYGSDDVIRKYTTDTAGYGINYLLDHDYARVYEHALDSYLRMSPGQPFRLLEFGCGGGMNLIRLVSLVQKRGLQLECAYGTDFSPRMVQAAEREAKALLAPATAAKVGFYAASNERLLEDLSAKRGRPTEDLLGFFDFIVGVNTFRYCHRIQKGQDCANDIFRMLRPGGVCVMIDMNNRFPAFRSRLKGQDQDTIDYYLPTLEEYAAPFQSAGFEVLRKGNFCWIPHSASRALTTCCRLASPFLNLVARSRAMRSLVVSRKPA